MARVLVVDDETDIRDFMQVVLASAGYETMLAANGSIALELMRDRKPCVVLLDMMMPVMDGWTFRERQLADPGLADVPVIGVTAVYDPKAVAEQLKIPCVAKPVNLDALLQKVEAACKRGQ